ncbi:MAG TPA: pitrilysin family protein [Chitinophagaceae bacterium]|nr:pitrilysin family protein [Chitinophagaceae bacterium]
MTRRFTWAVLLLFPLVLVAQTAKYPTIDIPYKKFVLPNGLRLIVHEDHKAPIVGVNIWYHVGSKNEKTGKTGFAHLFEHLMFNGSENYNNDYFKVMEAIGATDLNGTTNEDRTNYFQNVPVSALDRTLWLESDRMGHLLGAIDSGRLAEQRGVVQNEKRQGENQPYAIAWELTTKNTYPAGHPYSWTVIGSMEDLNAASLDDVKTWFKTYYGPNNAVLVIAGDIDPQAAYEKVKKYFGDIPAGPPIAKHEAWIAKMTESHRQKAEDRVAQPRLQKTWNVPQWGTKEVTYLQLLSSILTEGKSSRLYKRLVYDDQVTTNVYSWVDTKEISGQFTIQADAKPEVPLASVEKTIYEELKKLLAAGVTAPELERAKTQYFAGFLKGLERVGGFGGKSDVLAQNEVYGGSPDYYKKVQDWIKGATPADIKKVAQDWLQAGDYALEIMPYPTLNAVASDVDRKKLPDLDKTPDVKFPAAEKFKLSNGLQVLLVPRTSVPVVTMQLMVDAGYAADQTGKAGLSKLTMNMLNEGTKTRSSLQISNELADLGASMYTGASIDVNTVYMNALKSNLDKSLAVLSDVILNPVFPQKDFDRLKQEQLINITQEQTQPVMMGLRILPKLIYGEGHAYSNPFTGSGTTASVTSITRNDAIKYHQTWFAPNNATLLVVGDVTAAELKPKLEKQFAGWKENDVPKKNIANVALPEKPRVYIIDKPGAEQSIVLTGEVAPSGASADWVNMDMMNKILGGEFTSRINMNLREDKHWSYGSQSILLDTKGQSMFLSFAPVQTDKTKESVTELKKELEQYIKDKPATAEEFAKVQQNAVMQLPGGWETNGAVLRALEEQVKYNRGDDYWTSYASKIQNMNLQQINAAAQNVVKPSQMVWVIVGDRSKIEKGIRDLKLGDIHFIDSEGKEEKGF